MSAIALALAIGSGGTASADCTKIGPANGAVAQIVAKMNSTGSDKISPLQAVDALAAALTQIGLEKGNADALAKVVADLKAKGAGLAVADVLAALKNEFEPRVAQYAKENKCG